jgi:hypothetical protein
MPSPHRFRRPGRYYVGALTEDTDLVGTAMVANKYCSYPFFVEENFRISEIGFGVTSALAGAHGKIAIYCDLLDYAGQGLKFQPGKLLYGQPEQDCSTTGAKATALDPPLCLAKGRLYWLASCMSDAISVNKIKETYDLIGTVFGYWTGPGDLNSYEQYSYCNKTGLYYSNFPPDPFPSDCLNEQLTNVPAVYMKAA